MSGRAPAPMPAPFLTAVGLEKRFALSRGLFGGGGGHLPALRGVSFDIRSGETLGLVGESGSGKTTVGRVVARLVEPEAGRLLLDGVDWLGLKGRELRRRRRDVQIVFQDPLTSLNPRMRVGDQIAEPLRIQDLVPRAGIADFVRALLDDVGLAAGVASRFPSELSGGQRQRIAIARALATRPRLVICDEPVSALDVSIAAQIVNLLLDLREREGLSYLFISHDLAVVARVADRIAVLYLGRIVEEGALEGVTRRPQHPYTAALVSAVPRPDPSSSLRPTPIAGDPPSAVDPPPGCPFHPRCPIARPRCRDETPALREVEPGHRAACFYPGEMR